MKNTRYNGYLGPWLPRDVQMQRLQRVIQEELTELQRYTLTAYYFEEKTLEQIGNTRGVTKSTVWRTLRRTEDKIRRFLKY